MSLRSSRKEPMLPDSDESTIVTDLLTENGVVVVAADSKSIDNIWFIKFKECVTNDTPSTDDYGHTIPAGVNFLCGHFLEREYKSIHATLHKISKKKTFFYKESVLYPFIQVEPTKKGVQVTNIELANVSYYLEENGFSAI